MKRTIFALATYTLLLLSFVFVACYSDFDSAGDSELVVEGWIDSGRFPVVVLSHTVPISDEYRPTSSLDDYIERWARVTVSDGEREVVLTGKPDNDYFPPYIYTTSDLRGVSGRTYKLTVDCPDGAHAEASTTIPAVAAIDSFAVECVPDADSLRQLYVFVGGEHRFDGYYKVFTHVQGSPYGYLPSYLGIASGRQLSSDGRIPVNPGRTNVESDFDTYFAVGDTVMVKLARIDSCAYNFWRDFEDMVTLSRNPLFPVTVNLPSNVSGALGYWFGYGSAFATVIVRP